MRNQRFNNRDVTFLTRDDQRRCAILRRAKHRHTHASRGWHMNLSTSHHDTAAVHTTSGHPDSATPPAHRRLLVYVSTKFDQRVNNVCSTLLTGDVQGCPAFLYVPSQKGPRTHKNATRIYNNTVPPRCAINTSDRPQQPRECQRRGRLVHGRLPIERSDWRRAVRSIPPAWID